MGQGISGGITSENLTREQLRTLQRRFAQLCRAAPADCAPGTVAETRVARITDLQQLPELAGNLMVSRLFEILDRNGDGRLSLDEFILGVELFHFTTPQAGGTIDVDVSSLYRLAFMVYDLNGDGFVDATELHTMLQRIIGGSHVSEQQLDRVVQATMLQFDADGDRRLTLAEFTQLMSTTDLVSKFTFTLC